MWVQLPPAAPNIMTNNNWWIGDSTNTDPQALNIQPGKPVPSLDLIALRIEIGCTSRTRLWDEPFKPTISYTAPFIYLTDLLNYPTAIDTLVPTIWAYVDSEKQSGAIVQTHVALWIDNVTHPDVAAGVIPLPKGHRDTQLSNEEFTSAQVLVDHLTGNILDVKNTARY